MTIDTVPNVKKKHEVHVGMCSGLWCVCSVHMSVAMTVLFLLLQASLTHLALVGTTLWLFLLLSDPKQAQTNILISSRISNFRMA